MCAPFAVLRLRSSNTLQGHFFADEVRSDFNNTGICCARGARGCFDDVTPTTVAVGGTLALRDGCNLSNIEKVKVCGVDCPIDEPRPAGVITCTVPSVPGPLPATCAVEGVSGSGTFRSDTTIQVTP